MKTFILMWNPAISSYTWERFKEDQKEMCEDGWGEGVGNWSIWEHDKAEDGDRFFMVKVGEGTTGIVMAGYLLYTPYEAEDWSGKGRQTFYMDLNIEQQIDPDKVPILTTDVLQKEIPNFDWSGGHSGRVLDNDSALKLEKMWMSYINSVRCIEEEGAVFLDADIPFSGIMEEYYRDTKGETCELCGYNFKKVFGNDCVKYVEHDLFIDDLTTYNEEEGVKKVPISDEQLFSRIRCICANCRSIGTEHLYKKLF